MLAFPKTKKYKEFIKHSVYLLECTLQMLTFPANYLQSSLSVTASDNEHIVRQLHKFVCFLITLKKRSSDVLIQTNKSTEL